MPTAIKKTKMKIKKETVKTDASNEDTETEQGPTKNKIVEIDDSEPITPTVEEKVEEDPLVAATEDEDGSDEISLDGEDLNPFGDRWEE